MSTGMIVYKPLRVNLTLLPVCNLYMHRGMTATGYLLKTTDY